MARFVIRTHAVPMPASANGSTASTTAMSTTPAFAIAGCLVSISARMKIRAKFRSLRSHDALRGRGRPQKARAGPSLFATPKKGTSRGWSRPIRDAFAEQAGRAENEHGDQHEEREHVLIVAAEQREVRIADTALGDRRRPLRQLAEVRQVADIA